MEWNQDSLQELNRIGGTTQGLVKKMFAQAIQKRREAADLKAKVDAIIAEADDIARTAFAYIQEEEVRSIVNVAGDMLTRKLNTARMNLDKKVLRYGMLDHLDAKLVDKLFKAATKEGKAPEHEIGIAFKKGN